MWRGIGSGRWSFFEKRVLFDVSAEEWLQKCRAESEGDCQVSEIAGGHVNEHNKMPAVLHGAHPDANLRLVIVGDGYNEAEQAGFRADADRAVHKIRGTAPFDSVPICVARVDVASPESSAYRSFASAGVNTSFGCHFDKHDPHLLRVNTDRVMATVRAELPAHWHEHKILVLVNAPEIFGGSGMFSPGAGRHASGIAVVSNANGNETLMHELGHAFGLADESSGSPRMGGSPPNLATSLDELPEFWRARLTPGVELPTTGSARDVVGMFRAHAGPAHYRPQYSCIMKTASSLDRYCKVCVDWIETTSMARALERKAA